MLFNIQRFDHMLAEAAQKVIKLHKTPSVMTMPTFFVQRDNMELRLCFWKGAWELGIESKDIPWQLIENCELYYRLKAALMVGELCEKYEEHLVSTSQLEECAMRALEEVLK